MFLNLHTGLVTCRKDYRDKENWDGEDSITFGFLPLGNKQAPDSWDSAKATTGVAEQYFHVDKRIPIKKYS